MTTTSEQKNLQGTEPILPFDLPNTGPAVRMIV